MPARRFDRRSPPASSGRRAQDDPTARELAGFLKPPTVHCGERTCCARGALSPPPPELPTFKEGRGRPDPARPDRWRGRASRSSGSAPPTPSSPTSPAARATARPSPRSRSSSTSSARATAASSSTPTATRWSGSGPISTSPASPERVVEVDLGPARPSALPGWNLFELGGDAAASESAGRGDRRRLRLGAAMGRALDPRDQPDDPGRSRAGGDRRALAARAGADDLPDPDPAHRREWRRAALPFLPRASQRFWIDRFPLLAAEAITPLTNMVDRLRRSSRDHRACSARARAPTACARRWTAARSSSPAPGRAAPASACSPTCSLFDLLHAAREPGRARRPQPAAPSGSSSTRCRAMTAPPRATSPRCWSRAPSSGCGRSSEPEPRAAEPADAERADHQPLAPARHGAQLPRRRAAHQGVGRAQPDPAALTKLGATASSPRSPTAASSASPSRSAASGSRTFSARRRPTRRLRGPAADAAGHGMRRRGRRASRRPGRAHPRRACGRGSARARAARGGRGRPAARGRLRVDRGGPE